MKRRHQHDHEHDCGCAPRSTRRARREQRNELIRLERARQNDDRVSLRSHRANGFLIVGAVVAVILVASRLWPSPADPAQQPLAPPMPSATTTAPPTVAVIASATRDAAAAAAAWWQTACTLTPDRWSPDGMTDAAYRAAQLTPPSAVPATWTCQVATGEPLSGVRPDGTVTVRVAATRTVSPAGQQPAFTETATDVRVLVNQDGRWLVGSNPAN
ncbi:MAG TPA: hypothetical protein VIU11_04475 [Nakamurella sp.]